MLRSAAEQFPDAALFGIDVDRRAVAVARSRVPQGLISVGDSLSARSLQRTRVWKSRAEVDAVITNPPFHSDDGRPLTTTRAFGREVRCGVAAAHILSVAAHFGPTRIGAILPASVFHSDRDRDAVRLMGCHYAIRRVESLGRREFRGVSPASDIVVFDRRPEDLGAGDATDLSKSLQPDLSLVLVRGGLPVHHATRSQEDGCLGFVHTTELRAEAPTFPTVRPIGRGVVKGVAICVPRVGLPREDHLQVRSFAHPVQLSDCVLAFCFLDTLAAAKARDRIVGHFATFRSCWAGTGAAYTTLRKIEAFFRSIGIASRRSDGNSGCRKHRPEGRHTPKRQP